MTNQELIFAGRGQIPIRGVIKHPLSLAAVHFSLDRSLHLVARMDSAFTFSDALLLFTPVVARCMLPALWPPTGTRPRARPDQYNRKTTKVDVWDGRPDPINVDALFCISMFLNYIHS